MAKLPKGMPKGTQMRQDEVGTVRSIRLPPSSTPEASFITATDTSVAPRELAENFLRTTGTIYNISQENMSNLSGAAATEARAESMQLQFHEEKQLAGTSTVTFNQMVYGLPVWRSGISVQIAKDPKQVIS